MFWRFGGYANISTIDTILEKDSFQLEDLLDESDLIQELKSHNAKLVEYLRDQQILEKLLQYVVAPRAEPAGAACDQAGKGLGDDDKGKGAALPFRPRSSSGAAAEFGDDDDPEAIEKKRNRYAFVAAEILSSDNWSIYEALMEIPLDNLQASYFTKVNESLFDKKTEEMLDLLRSMDGAVPDILKHVDCPNIMDLLLRIISLERTESGQGIVEWLYTQDVIPSLLSFLGPEHNWSTQTSAGDFLKAIITVSANASQNEQTCIGPNELTRQLVSKPCVEQLIKYMLGGGNPLTCGVGIIIEVIRKNNSDYDPDGAEPNSLPSSRDPIYLGTLLRLFAQHIPDFMNLIMNGPSPKFMTTTSGQTIKPLGFDRFKTCELMAELLHCSNMGLLNEVGAEEAISARDAHRQRLRDEGRLAPLRAEDAPSSADDLTMRMSQSSPAEEVRRLEVMNVSDDDGFEEVTHAPDEDNSHGVEELPEVPLPPSTSSFLDKDLDDFVDEPLSSPRLNVRELDSQDNESEQQPNEQDAEVRPLSRTKKVAVDEAAQPEQKEVQTDVSQEKQPAAEDAPKDVTVDFESEPEAGTEAQTPSLAVATSGFDEPRTASVTVTPIDEKSFDLEDMSPHPEDTPAPLFSSQESATTAGSPPIRSSTDDESAKPKEQPAANEISVETESQTATTKAEPSQLEKENPVVNPESEPTTPIDDSPINSRPVVGDYLKIQFVEHRVVPTILSFFFAYPWNNFLHNVVYDIVQQVFNGPMDRGFNPTLAISLFDAADITNQIINGQQKSEESEKKSKTRMGYMGHLTLIAEEVVKFTERHAPEVLGDVVLQKVMDQDWISYVEGPLAETRERDNAILGGVRPEVAMSNRLNAGLGGGGLSGLGSIGLSGGTGSSALAEAGLGGGQDVTENTVGPFAISSGTLMSGFGSSSDEDDDEEQDNEEDVNNEFRAYTDPLNAANSSSMNPPSIPPPPPPPPPLNIPPSRARLQLAARLAMNKRNAAAAAANGGEEDAPLTSDNATGSGTFSSPNASASDRLRNPFADDDEDDDDHRPGFGSGSGSGSDDDDGDANTGDNHTGGGSSWNRGSWWRGVVRTARRGSGRKDNARKQETERFGDGRDDETDSDDAVADEDDDIEDEEFGDFAMPETNTSSSGTGGGGMVSGIDPAREKFLLKPLPVHPSPGGSGKLGGATSPFGSLWPFSSSSTTTATSKDHATSDPATAGDHPSLSEKTPAGVSAQGPPITEEPVDLAVEDEEGVAVVVGEDGQKINRAVEAKRRTSIEDPDEDDEKVGGEEIIVGRPSGTAAAR